MPLMKYSFYMAVSDAFAVLLGTWHSAVYRHVLHYV